MTGAPPLLLQRKNSEIRLLADLLRDLGQPDAARRLLAGDPEAHALARRLVRAPEVRRSAWSRMAACLATTSAARRMDRLMVWELTV